MDGMRRHIKASMIAGIGVVLSLLVAVVGTGIAGATADDHADGATCFTAKATISDVPQRVSQAWVANDAVAFGNVFTADASFIVPGEDTYLKSRAEIRAYMANIFAGPYKDVRPIANVLNLKCIDRDVAVVVTQGGLLMPGETVVPPERIGRQTWTIVRQHRDWLATAYQNSRITSG
jgi:uncharacterized protein (TIGR02246 family)